MYVCAVRVSLLALLVLPRLAFAQHALENPQNASVQSGIAVISGWKCTANGQIAVRFDGGAPVSMAYGTTRADTAPVCGDDGNNGFGLLFNWNLLGDGQHLVEVLDNGEVFAAATVTVTTFGVEFLGGQSGSTTVTFAGRQVTLMWSEAQQNFVITRVGGGNGGGGLTGTYAYVGTFNANSCSTPLPEGPAEDRFQITQNGSSLTAVASGGTLTMMGAVEPDGDFFLASAPQASSPSSGCTLNLTIVLEGNTAALNDVKLTFENEYEGSCAPRADCEVEYRGPLTRIAAGGGAR